MPEKVKRLRVLAGPNGSGKSTVVFHILRNYYCGFFLNADELNKMLQQHHKLELPSFDAPLTKKEFDDYLATTGKSWVEKATEEKQPVHLSFSDHSLITEVPPGDYDAAIAADFLRYQLIKEDKTFTFETVLSDDRKVDFLKEAASKGFKLYLYFVCTKDPEINKVRVANRVAKGGHDVPPDKVVNRYYSSLKVLSALIPHTYRCYLFDNSEEGDQEKINLVAEIEQGRQLTIKSEDVPLWVEQYVIEPLFIQTDKH